MPLSTGKILNNRYRIVKLLGQGGFGAVYRAWDLNLNAPCALKESLNTTPEAVRQFTLEARLLANLRHVNLPAVIDHFSVEGQGQYLVMDFVEGQDLQQMLQRSGGPLPEGQVLAWMLQVCDTLTYLHSQNPPVIHRDIKPANIKITPQGQVKLVDFGIAKQYYHSQKTTLGARAVTPGFSPPEQYGKGGTDARTDVYAVGATLYATLTSHAPKESLDRETGNPLPAPRTLNPAITISTECAILKALEMAPEHRFQNAADLKAALSAALSDIQAPSTQAAKALDQPSPQTPATSPIVQRRKRTNLIAGALIALGLVCVLAMSVVLLGGAGYFGSNGPINAGSRRVATRTSRPAKASIEATLPSGDQGSLPPSVTPFTTGQAADGPGNPTSTGTPTPTESPTLTPVLPSSPTPTVQGIWQPCPGTIPSQLHVGMRASVSFHPPKSNNVRRQPNDHAAITGNIDPGEQMDILDGPSCQGGYVWWKIRSLSSGLAGWTAEGDQSNYWLLPVP
jgi:eukaryotic-like serine/threonine-protein kinase